MKKYHIETLKILFNEVFFVLHKQGSQKIFGNFLQVFKNTHIWSIFSSLRLKTVLNSIKH